MTHLRKPKRVEFEPSKNEESDLIEELPRTQAKVEIIQAINFLESLIQKINDSITDSAKKLVPKSMDDFDIMYGVRGLSYLIYLKNMVAEAIVNQKIPIKELCFETIDNYNVFKLFFEINPNPEKPSKMFALFVSQLPRGMKGQAIMDAVETARQHAKDVAEKKAAEDAIDKSKIAAALRIANLAAKGAEDFAKNAKESEKNAIEHEKAIATIAEKAQQVLLAERKFKAEQEAYHAEVLSQAAQLAAKRAEKSAATAVRSVKTTERVTEFYRTIDYFLRSDEKESGNLKKRDNVLVIKTAQAWIQSIKEEKPHISQQYLGKATNVLQVLISQPHPNLDLLYKTLPSEMRESEDFQKFLDAIHAVQWREHLLTLLANKQCSNLVSEVLTMRENYEISWVEFDFLIQKPVEKLRFGLAMLELKHKIICSANTDIKTVADNMYNELQSEYDKGHITTENLSQIRQVIKTVPIPTPNHTINNRDLIQYTKALKEAEKTSLGKMPWRNTKIGFLCVGLLGMAAGLALIGVSLTTLVFSHGVSAPLSLGGLKIGWDLLLASGALLTAAAGGLALYECNLLTKKNTLFSNAYGVRDKARKAEPITLKVKA